VLAFARSIIVAPAGAYKESFTVDLGGGLFLVKRANTFFFVYLGEPRGEEAILNIVYSGGPS
jgi:hypothetical protein